MADEKDLTPEQIEKSWRIYLELGEDPDNTPSPWYTSKRLRPLYLRLPSNPRCRLCYYPFKGVGGAIMRTFFHIQPSKLNPHICNLCETFMEKYQGGAEVDLAILFADVRGSTHLAESMSPRDFSKLINRFYNATTWVLFDRGGMVEKLSGDAVTAFFTAGITGPDYHRVALDAAREILTANSASTAGGPAIPIGIGLHAGRAYVGAVSSDAGVKNIAVLGDTVNIGARLAALAAPGEILISHEMARQAGIEAGEFQIRRTELKGRSAPIDVCVLKGTDLQRQEFRS
jgi:adenylate cyclase